MSTNISRYELLEILGEGGVGIVYKALDPALNKIVALKILNGSQLSDDRLQRFQNEARALAELKHDAIPEIFNFAVSESGAPYMVMELIEGRPLNSVLEEQSVLDVDAAIDVAIQVCDALHHAHKLLIFHRDLKPSNIIVTDTGQVKVIDFGLAKLEKELVRPYQFRTQTGMVMGSPLYMSPEQLRGNEADERSDIYSLGCVLYEMLSGTPPYRGNTVLETANMHLTNALPVLPERLECTKIIRDDLQKIIDRCLAIDIKQRFQNMRDLKVALNALTAVESEPIRSKNVARTPLLTLLVVCVVVCGVGLIFWILSPTKDKEPENLVPLPDPVLHLAVNSVPRLAELPAPAHNPWHISHSHTASQSNIILDADFKLLADSKERNRITRVRVDQSNITGTGIRFLEGMHIRSLTIYSPNLSDEALGLLSLFPELCELRLGYAKKVTLKGYKHIARSHLKILKLSNMQLPAGALLELSKNSDLEMLILKNELKEKIRLDFRHLAAMRNLSSLVIQGFGFTSKDLVLLSCLKRLIFLNLNTVDIDDSNLEVLSSLPALRQVRLTGTKITDLGLEKLEKIKNLELLDISNCALVSERRALDFKYRHKPGRYSKGVEVLFGRERTYSLSDDLGRDFEDGKIDYKEQKVGL